MNILDMYLFDENHELSLSLNLATLAGAGLVSNAGK